jgi:formylmethanofuran dehydrogenase subunit E
VQLDVPVKELFTVQHVQIKIPAYAPIFDLARCALCGEKVMESRARLVDGRPACIACASAAHYQLDGSGTRVA